MTDYVPPVREGAMRRVPWHGMAWQAGLEGKRSFVNVELDARQEWGKSGVNPSSGALIFHPHTPGGEGCGGRGGSWGQDRRRRTAAKRSRT